MSVIRHSVTFVVICLGVAHSVEKEKMAKFSCSLEHPEMIASLVIATAVLSDLPASMIHWSVSYRLDTGTH